MKPDLEQTLLEKICASKAGREIDPAVVGAAVRWALARYNPKDAEKAAKTRLHQLYGSYVGEGWSKAAGKVLSQLQAGVLPQEDAARKLMALHGSTRERLDHVQECYARVFAVTGMPASVLDVACGLNPLAFALPGMTGASIEAIDAGQDVADVLNHFFAAAPMPLARASAGDAMVELPAGHYDLALIMKFLPLAERIETGGALRLLRAIPARRIVVSFPTRSLSGRNVGMEENYSKWFEGLGYSGDILERFVCGEEVFYLVAGQTNP